MLRRLIGFDESNPYSFNNRNISVIGVAPDGDPKAVGCGDPTAHTIIYISIVGVAPADGYSRQNRGLNVLNRFRGLE